MNDMPSLSQKEVLQLLGIRFRDLKKLETSGQIRRIKITGKTVRYYASDVRRVQIGSNLFGGTL